MREGENLEERINEIARRVALLEKQCEKKESPPGFCHSSLKKGELAQFFYILMEEQIFFFEKSNAKVNRMRFQAFAEQYFTYSGDDGAQLHIRSFSRHFSEAKGYTYRDKHLAFLDKIISLLQERRLRLINK